MNEGKWMHVKRLWKSRANTRSNHFWQHRFQLAWLRMKYVNNYSRFFCHLTGTFVLLLYPLAGSQWVQFPQIHKPQCINTSLTDPNPSWSFSYYPQLHFLRDIAKCRDLLVNCTAGNSNTASQQQWASVIHHFSIYFYIGHCQLTVMKQTVFI